MQKTTLVALRNAHSLIRAFEHSASTVESQDEDLTSQSFGISFAPERSAERRAHRAHLPRGSRHVQGTILRSSLSVTTREEKAQTAISFCPLRRHFVKLPPRPPCFPSTHCTPSLSALILFANSQNSSDTADSVSCPSLHQTTSTLLL